MEGGEFDLQSAVEQENARKQQAYELTKMLFSEDETRKSIEQGIIGYGGTQRAQVEMSRVDEFLVEKPMDQQQSPKPEDGAVYSIWSMLTSELKENPQLINEIADEEKYKEWKQDLADKVKTHYSNTGAGSA